MRRAAKARLDLARLKPGDVVIFSPAEPIDEAEQDAIRHALALLLPEQTTIVSGTPLDVRIVPSWWAEAGALAFVAFVIGVLWLGLR